MDELNGKLFYLIDNMEELVMKMRSEKEYYDATSELFRIFHSIRSLASYLKIDTLVKTAFAIEDILSIIRFKRPPILPEILDWLLILCDHIKSWSDTIENHEYDFAPVDVYTMNMVKTAVVFSRKPNEILKELDIFFCANSTEISDKVESIFKNKIKSLNIIKSEKELRNAVKTKQPAIFIFDAKDHQQKHKEIVEYIKKEYIEIPVVLLVGKNVHKEKELFKDSNIQILINIDSGLHTLLHKAEVLADKFYKNKKIKLLLAPTIKRIELLRPLPQVITDIRSFESKEGASLRELSNIITKDPLLCAKILKTINSPAYPIRGEMSSIHQAVTLLGKENIVSLALHCHLEEEVAFDLSPYGITLETFFEIAKKRMNLAMKWYSKISLDKLGIVTTAALLSNLGQIIISETILQERKSNEFLAMLMETNSTAAEIEYVYTTTEDTTADLLEHWGLDKAMVEGIRFSSDLGNAPNELKTIAIVLHVVCNTIALDSEDVKQEKVEEMADFLRELNFNTEHYLNAVAKIS